MKGPIKPKGLLFELSTREDLPLHDRDSLSKRPDIDIVLQLKGRRNSITGFDDHLIAGHISPQLDADIPA